MNSEERDELKQNDLQSFGGKASAWLWKYASHILLVVALVVLAWQGLHWYRTNEELKRQAAWTDLTNALNSMENVPDALRKVVNDHEYPAVRAMAYLKLGDHHLAAVLTNRTAAEQSLADAEAAYGRVLQQYGGETLTALYARLGLARVHENRGQWDKAADLYRTIATDAGKAGLPSFVEMANFRLGHLDEWKQPVAIVRTPAPAATQPK